MNSTVTKREINLDLLRQGERSEMAALVENYSNPVYRIAMNILHSEQDAEDVLQETFIKVMHGIRHFEGRSSLTTWIYRIAVNEALMLIRRRRGNQVSLDAEVETAEGEAAPIEIEDWCCRPEAETMSAELRGEMDKAIANLPEKLRIVFQLRDIEDLSIRETAQVLGLTESAVKTRLLRARLTLREELTHYFQDSARE
jgi:RNA polymerase sigma-70 factor (ECF subfamily)